MYFRQACIAAIHSLLSISVGSTRERAACSDKMINKQLCIAILSLVLVVSSSAPTVVAGGPPSSHSLLQRATFYRTELYFGRSVPGGGEVSDDDWKKFLDEVVTPRFPDGFTVLKASGHYREQSGRIITEPSEVIVFLYPLSRRTSSRRKIEEIRRAYKTQFKQESVLRLDIPAPVKVFF